MAPKRQQYDESTKAAVMAALLAGQSVEEIAKKYKVPENTLKSWKSRQGGNSVATVATHKKEHIGDLLIDYLSEALITLKAQVVIFRNENWLKTQSAQELAVLHGVVTDKAIRLLEALQSDADEGEGSEE